MNPELCAPEPKRGVGLSGSTASAGHYRFAVVFQSGRGVVDQRLIQEAAGCDLISVDEPAAFAQILANVVPELILVDLNFDLDRLLAVLPALEAAGYAGRAPCIGISTRLAPEPPVQVVRQLDRVIRLPLHRKQFITVLGVCL